VIPFALITWGETHVESGLASVLQGTAALFTLVLAHFAFADERITPRKLAGLLTGFLGVAVLATRSTAPGADSADVAGQLLGQAAIIGASFCYGVGGVYSRKAMQQRLEPVVIAAGTMSVAAALTGIITLVLPLLGGAAPVGLGQLDPGTLGAVLALGLVNTFGAYLIFYPLMATLGATRTSMVTYVIPVVGVLLGALFLGERVDLPLLAGMVLILGSIAIVNLNLRWRSRPAPRVPATVEGPEVDPQT
jgi:drug/metabolite transporter (DMT)-like permease